MIKSSPHLGLRRKASATFDLLEADADHHREMLGCLKTLLHQGEAYRCGDYLRNRSPSMVEFKKSSKDSSLDENCREKMCEWGYKVCDHFRIPREIVAFAFSYLDRFVERCGCDRTAFKLAAMTSLYIATKTLNGKQISISTLAELSRGEFQSPHIAEMERIMLDILEWKLHPPTVQAYIRQLLLLTPSRKDIELIYHHAMFLAEMSVFDYEFVKQDRLLIALGAVMIAVQGAMKKTLADFVKTNILERLRTEYDVKVDLNLLEDVQQRLFFLYTCSTQIQHDDVSPIRMASYRFDKEHSFKGHFDHVHSPVSVIQKDL